MTAHTSPLAFRRILLKLVAYRKLHYVNLIFQTLLFYFLELAPGLIVQRLFNLLATGSALGNEPWTLIAIIAGVFFARWQSIPAWMISDAVVVTAGETLMRRNMLANVMQQPGARALPSSAGEAISRFRDDARLLSRFLTFLPDMPSQVVALLLMLAVLASVNLPLTLIMIIPIVISMAAAQFSSRFVKRFSQQTQEAVGEVTGSLGEILGAVQAVKLAGKEQRVVAAFQRAGEKRRRALLRMTLVMETISAFSWNTTAFATAGVLLGAVLTGEVENMTAGDFGLFATYAGSMGFLVGFFGELLGRSKQSVVSAQRMVDVMAGAAPDALAEHQSVDAKTVSALEVPNVSGGPLRRLHVAGLSYIHPGSEAGITDASFHMQRGSLTVITGRIGSGKTTLLRALLGLLPGQGSVMWNDKAIENRDVFFQPPNSAYVPQVPRLFSDTLRDNVVMGAPVDPADKDVAAAIRSAVFERDVADFELGLDTLVGVRGAKVSGGQLQRTAAARAFVRKAELLVVDDLSSALDVETESLLWQRVFEQAGERTVLAVSHRRPALDRADHIIVLKNGRILDQGPLRALLDRCVEMREIYDAPLA